MEKNFSERLTGKDKNKIRQFGFSFAIGMLILFIVSLWKRFSLPVQILILFFGFLHLFSALFLNKLLIPTYTIMSFIAKILGNVIITTIFTIVFYLLFTPIAIILRFSGKDVINKNSEKTLWIKIDNKRNDPKQIEKMF